MTYLMPSSQLEKQRPCIPIFMQICRRPCRQRLADFARNVAPSLIAESLAEIAQVAEITGDVASALRWDGYPTLIGESLAETAETAETPIR
jgi:hypothetical protein